VIQTGDHGPTPAPKPSEPYDPIHYCEDPAVGGGLSQGGRCRPDRSAHSVPQQHPQILHCRNQPALDLLPPQSPPSGLLSPVIVDGIGKAALHDVLPALAVVARRRTVGLPPRRFYQGRLHMPPNRPPSFGLRALLPQRTMGARGGIRNQVDLDLLLRAVLMTHQIVTLRTAQAIPCGLVDKPAQGQLAPLFQVRTDFAQVGAEALLRAEDIITGRAIMVVAR
jgi:hypothetical protein